jgi:hypothetical protein
VRTCMARYQAKRDEKTKSCQRNLRVLYGLLYDFGTSPKKALDWRTRVPLIVTGRITISFVRQCFECVDDKNQIELASTLYTQWVNAYSKLSTLEIRELSRDCTCPGCAKTRLLKSIENAPVVVAPAV